MNSSILSFMPIMEKIDLTVSKKKESDNMEQFTQ